MSGFGVRRTDAPGQTGDSGGEARDITVEEVGESEPPSGGEGQGGLASDDEQRLVPRAWAPSAPRRARVGGDEASGAWLDGKRLDRGRRSRDGDAQDDLELNPAVRGLAEFVSANIRYEMARSDVTQRDVADVIGKSRAAVSLRMHDRVPWTLWEVGMVAELLGMQPSELLSTRVRRW